MPTKIKVPCPKCGHVATVEIATIDRLREENERLRARLAQYEYTGDDSAVDKLMDMFGMKH